MLTGGVDARFSILYGLSEETLLNCNSFRIDKNIGDIDSFNIGIFFGYEYRAEGYGTMKYNEYWRDDVNNPNLNSVATMIWDIAFEQFDFEIISDAIDTLNTKIIDIMEKLIDTFTDLKILDILDVLLDGVAEFVGGAWQTVSSWAQDLVPWAKQTPMNMDQRKPNKYYSYYGKSDPKLLLAFIPKSFYYIFILYTIILSTIMCLCGCLLNNQWIKRKRKMNQHQILNYIDNDETENNTENEK